MTVAVVLGLAIGFVGGGLIGFYVRKATPQNTQARDDILPRKATQ